MNVSFGGSPGAFGPGSFSVSGPGAATFPSQSTQGATDFSKTVGWRQWLEDMGRKAGEALVQAGVNRVTSSGSSGKVTNDRGPTSENNGTAPYTPAGTPGPSGVPTTTGFDLGGVLSFGDSSSTLILAAAAILGAVLIARAM